MIKIVTSILLISSSLIATAQNQKNMKTTEKFDATSYYAQKYKEQTGQEADHNDELVYTEPDGTDVNISWGGYGEYSYFLCQIPHRAFREDCKEYYPNMSLKNERHWLFMTDGTIRIGIWRDYDSVGNLISEVDYDRQFDSVKMKPKDLLQWMHNRKLINLETGEGEERFATQQSSNRFKISFFPAEKGSLFKKRSFAAWSILDIKYLDNGFQDIVNYYINAETGELDNTTFYQKPPKPC